MPKESSGSVLVIAGKLCARIRYTDANGNRREIRRQVANEKEGQKILEKIRRQLRDNGPAIVDGDRMTFGELADRYQTLFIKPPEYADGIKIAGMRSWRTRKQMLGVLKDHFGNRRLNAITVSALEEFASIRRRAPRIVSVPSPPAPDGGRRQPIKKPVGGRRNIATINRELELLRAVLNYAEREGWITRNPFFRGSGIIRRAEEVPRERILSEDEEARLLGACVGRCEHLRPIVIAALDTAARQGELFQLKWSDVDRSRLLIRLTSYKGKRTTFRKVAMTERLASEIEMLWAVSDKNPDTLVFGIVNNVKNGWATVCKNAGIEDLRFHDLRHTATTNMVRAGVSMTAMGKMGISPSEVMKLTGHTQPVTFARYVNTNEETASRLAEALDAMRKVVPIDGRTKKRAG